MQTVLLGQIPSAKDATVWSLLSKFAHVNKWNQLRVAVAYASVAGLMKLLDGTRADKQQDGYQSQWLIGLDDYLTQPGVLRICRSLPGAELRTAELSAKRIRFHPKLLIVSQNQSLSLACVGSSNLTLGGLVNNCEAVAAITSTTRDDNSHVLEAWNSIWQLGQVATDESINDYEARYNANRPPSKDDPGKPDKDKNKPADAESPSEILTADSPHLDPSLAQTCWIEVGSNTGKGSELEFKGEQSLFFDLSPSGDIKQYRRFITSSGEAVRLPMRFQENRMWRLQMNRAVPEVAAGLRPRHKATGDLGRSPYVAIFTRSPDRIAFTLRFIRDNSAEYTELRAKSAVRGTSGRTRSRRYGWC